MPKPTPTNQPAEGVSRGEFDEGRPSAESLTEPLFNLTTGSCSCSDQSCNICKREGEVMEAWIQLNVHADTLEAQLKAMEAGRLCEVAGLEMQIACEIEAQEEPNEGDADEYRASAKAKRSRLAELEADTP